jgi:hypothetical protein
METIQVKEVQKLKLNVTNINSFLKKSSKDYTKVKKDNKRLVSDQVKRNKTKEKEKTIEKKSVGGSALSNVKDVAKSSAGIFDKILSFGGILLSGILLNALPSIKKKIDEFAEENKEVINNVVSVLTVVKDFAVNLFDSFTGPYSQEGSLDWLGKFNDSGKLDSGVLKEIEKTYNDMGKMINDIDKAMGGKGTIGNVLITADKVLHKKNGQTGVLDRATGEFTQRSFTEEESRRFQSGDTRIDVPSSLGSGNVSLNSLTDQQFSDLAYAVSGEAQRGTPDEYGVAANILTRLADPGYPNTIMGVFTAPGQYAAYEDGGARRDSQLAAKLKANKDKIAEAIEKLNGRTDFKGTSQYGNMGPGDIKFSDRGNFYHYASQRGRNSPPPSNPPTYWKKLITPKQKAQTPATTSSTQTAPAQLTSSAAAKDNKNSLLASLTSVEEDNDTNFLLIIEPVMA